MNFQEIFLQAAPGAGGSQLPFLLMMVGMIVVMYFFMIRPQQKKAKEQKAFQESIKAGEKVVTTSGIHGKIIETNNDGTVLLSIDRNTNVIVESQAISMDMTTAFRKRAGITTTTPAATAIEAEKK